MKWSDYDFKPKRYTSRILSRIFDYILSYLIFTFVLSYSTDFLDDILYLIGFVASPILWAPIEALLISTIGTTPGKAILGIHVRNKDGSKLSFTKALRRSLYFFSFAHDNKHKSRIYKPKRYFFRYVIFTILAAALITPLVLDEYIDGREEHSLISRLVQEPIKMEWKEFKAPYGDFKIVFPSKPVEGTSVLGKAENALPVTEYSAEKKDQVKYSVSYTTLPHKWVRWGSGLVLKGALKMMAKHLGNKVVWKSSQKYRRLPAIDYLLSSGKVERHGKLVLVGHRLYKIEITYPKEKKEETASARHAFINSFQPQN